MSTTEKLCRATVRADTPPALALNENGSTLCNGALLLRKHRAMTFSYGGENTEYGFRMVCVLGNLKEIICSRKARLNLEKVCRGAKAKLELFLTDIRRISLLYLNLAKFIQASHNPSSPFSCG